MTGTAEPTRALVLCTGNSCRSIMAEALINQEGAGRYRAVSAGSRPTGSVHPKALDTLARHGVDPGTPKSKSWDAFTGESFDLVITVCDAAARECPVYPGAARRLHWSIPDPALASGGDATVTQAFERAFETIRDHIRRELT